MPSTLTTSISIRVVAHEESATGLGPPVVKDHVFEVNQNIPGGTTAGRADLVYSATRNVNAGASDDLDLVGALQLAMGGNINAARLVGLYIKNTSTSTGNKLVVGGAASNQLYAGLFGGSGHTIEVGPNGHLEWTSPTDPATVTGGTADLLRVNNPGATPIAYQILVLARSA